MSAQCGYRYNFLPDAVSGTVPAAIPAWDFYRTSEGHHKVGAGGTDRRGWHGRGCRRPCLLPLLSMLPPVSLTHFHTMALLLPSCAASAHTRTCSHHTPASPPSLPSHPPLFSTTLALAFKTHPNPCVWLGLVLGLWAFAVQRGDDDRARVDHGGRQQVQGYLLHGGPGLHGLPRRVSIRRGGVGWQRRGLAGHRPSCPGSGLG